MKEYNYTVILQAETEGGFSAIVPALPGCASQGENVQEALDNVREAIEVFVETLIQLKKPVPLEEFPPARLEVVKIVA